MDFSKHLNFLRELKDNNNREWFQGHNDLYQSLRLDFKSFVEDLLKAISGFDPDISALQSKDCIFRINRDIRFSKDKSPYKTNFGAYIAKGGKKSNNAGYYFHLSPEESFLAGGLWMPPTNILNNIRQEIDYNETEFLEIVNSKSFKKYFKEIEGEKLKTAPKGYRNDHHLIEFLRLKSLVVSYNISDQELCDFSTKKAVPVYKAILPFNNFINRGVES